MSMRVTAFVSWHSETKNTARLVHLCLADAAICGVCMNDNSCRCAVVTTRRISRAELVTRTNASTSAVKAALQSLITSGLIERLQGGTGSDVSLYAVHVASGLPGCVCGYCVRYAPEPLRTAVNASGVTFRPPVDDSFNRGSDSDLRGSDLHAGGSDSGPNTYTYIHKEKDSTCGLSKTEQIRNVQQAKEALCVRS
jgi:hypothetical protein